MHFDVWVCPNITASYKQCSCVFQCLAWCNHIDGAHALSARTLEYFLSLVDLKGGRPNHGTVPMPHYGWVGLCGSQVLHWLQSLHSGWLWELGAYCAPPAHAFSWQLSRCGCPPGRWPTLQVHPMLESVYQRLQVWALWLTVEPASPPEHSPAFTKFHVVFPEHYYYPYRGNVVSFLTALQRPAWCSHSLAHCSLSAARMCPCPSCLWARCWARGAYNFVS